MYLEETHHDVVVDPDELLAAAEQEEAVGHLGIVSTVSSGRDYGWKITEYNFIDTK